MNQYERYLSYLPEIQKLQSESIVTGELSVNEIINHLKKININIPQQIIKTAAICPHPKLSLRR